MKFPLLTASLILLFASAAHAGPPANDAFASAKLLTGKSGHIILDISQATEEPGEALGGETTVWYRVSIPAGKTLLLDTFGSDFDTVIEAGPTAPLANFFGYYSSDDAQGTPQSRLLVRSFQDSGSQSFHIRARGTGSATGELHLNYRQFDGPIFELEGAEPFAGREGGVAEVGVHRYGKVSAAASVQVLLEDLSATAGVDFLGLPVTVTFAKGETFKVARVPIYKDGDIEGPERAGIVLANASANAVIGDNDRGTLFIDDEQDDPANDPFEEELSGYTDTTTGDSTGAGSDSWASLPDFGIEESRGYARTVWYSWWPVASGLAELRITGHAADGGEFVLGVAHRDLWHERVPVPGAVRSYDPDTGEQVFRFDATAGTLYRILVTARGADGGPFTLRYKILEAGALELVPGQTFREDDGTATVTVRRVGGSLGSVTVHYATAAPNGFAPEADPASDYTAASGTLTFDYGITERTFTIAIAPDTDTEGTENIPILLSNATGGAAILTAERSISIDEEEDAPANDFFADAQPITGGKGEIAGDNAGAGAEAGEPAGLRESVWYSWVVSATGFAELRAGNDYSYKIVTVYRGGTLPTLTEAATGAFPVTAGETLWIAISTAPDEGFIAEPFTLSWEISTGNLFHFATDYFGATEGEATAIIRIERDGPATAAAAVFLQTSDFSPGWGKATAGTDYKATRIKVAFPAGQTFREIPIPIFADNKSEGVETLGLSLDGASRGSVVGGLSTATLEIWGGADFVHEKATYAGTVNPLTVTLGESGYLTATTTTAGALSGQLLLGGTSYRFKGSLASGLAHILIPRKGVAANPFILDLYYIDRYDPDLGITVETLAGTLTIDDTTLDIVVTRNRFTKASPTYFGGRYTASLSNYYLIAGVPFYPAYATFTVAPSTGAVKMAGTLVDGTKFSWGTLLARDGTIPVSIPLYKHQGLLHGNLLLGDYTPQNDGSGWLTWIHPVQAKGQFSSAFECDLAAGISAYADPKGARALPLPDPGDAYLDIYDHAASFSIQRNCRMDDRSAIRIIAPSTNEERVTFKVAPATGLFTGSFRPPGGKTTRFSGVLHQRSGRAFGLHFGPTGGGSVTIAE